MPLVGLFVGLQVSVPLGNVLMAPIIGLVMLTGQPMGMMTNEFRLVAWLISGLFWALVFCAVPWAWRRFRA